MPPLSPSNSRVPGWCGLGLDSCGFGVLNRWMLSSTQGSVYLGLWFGSRICALLLWIGEGTKGFAFTPPSFVSLDPGMKYFVSVEVKSLENKLLEIVFRWYHSAWKSSIVWNHNFWSIGWLCARKFRSCFQHWSGNLSTLGNIRLIISQCIEELEYWKS